MPQKALNEHRKYQRLVPTEGESKYLARRGFRSVVSSNVSAVAKDGETLIVRFHGGATYGYPTSGDRYYDMLNASSKGRFVWTELRRAGVPYYRMGAVNIDDDVEPVRTPHDGASVDGHSDGHSEGRTLLAALALSTMVAPSDLLSIGIIAGLALVRDINSNTASSSNTQSTDLK